MVGPTEANAGYKTYDFAPDRLPSELLQSLGYVSAAAAQAEFCINAAIAGVVGLNELVGMSVTTHMSMPMRFQALRSGGHMRWGRDDPTMKALEELIVGLEAAFEQRNKFVHGSWAVDPVDGSTHLIRQSARKSVQMARQAVGWEVVRAAGDRLTELGHEVMGLTIQAGLEVPPPDWW